VFGNLVEARVLCEAYRVWYNEYLPHSAKKCITLNRFEAGEENKLPVSIHAGLEGEAA